MFGITTDLDLFALQIYGIPFDLSSIRSASMPMAIYAIKHDGKIFCKETLKNLICANNMYFSNKYEQIPSTNMRLIGV